jgi:uncharacterized membrane protein
VQTRVTAATLGVFVAGFVAFALWVGDWYATWKALHVLSAIIWVGGAIYIQLLAFRIFRLDDPVRIQQFAKDAEMVGARVFTPAALLLVVLGFVLVSNGDWPYTFWIVFALAVWLLSFVFNVVLVAPESGRIATSIKERGGVDAAVRDRIERMYLYSRVETMLLALAAIDMVLKPGA